MEKDGRCQVESSALQWELKWRAYLNGVGLTYLYPDIAMTME